MMRPNSFELVSIAVEITDEKHLKKINIKNTIAEIIRILIEEHSLPGDIIEYGLRITHVKNKKCLPQYITDENKFKLIQDGCEVKLVEAPKIYLATIFNNVFSKEKRNSGYALLDSELHDEVLLKLIAEFGWHVDISHKVIKDISLTNYEIMVSFNLIYKLLKRKYISNISGEFVEKAIDCILKADEYTPKLIFSALLLIRQLLLLKLYFGQIYCNLTIDHDLISILKKNKDVPSLHFVVLSVINIIVKLCTREHRKDVIKIMNKKKCRQIIFDNVISNDKKLTRDIEKELHCYQTYILRIYEEKLLVRIDINDEHNIHNQLKNLNEDLLKLSNENIHNGKIATFENDFVDEKDDDTSFSQRFSFFKHLPPEILSIFNDDNEDTSSIISFENIFETNQLRSSTIDDATTSISSKSENETSIPGKEFALNSNSNSNSNLNSIRDSVNSIDSSIDVFNILTDGVSYHDKSTKLISQLTFDCLVYFKENYPQAFYMALLRENEYSLGFYCTCEQICSILCSELRIGQEPCKRSTLYCPLIFNTKQKPFVMEIFCRLYWLFTRTRLEMHAKTIDDQEKVLNVLKAQFKLVLSTKPKTYTDVTGAMKTFTYAFVKLKWDKEQKLKWKYILKNNPSVQELTQRVEPELIKLIEKKRLNYLKVGDALFRIDTDKKNKQQMIRMQLSQNQKQLFISDLNDLEVCSFDIKTINISDINYLVTGEACLHVKEHRSRKPEYAFSLLLTETSYEFEATSENQYNKLMDCIHILLAKKMSSKLYHEERNQLIEIEMLLALLDVENVPLPIEAPPVPPLPPNYDFTDNSIVL